MANRNKISFETIYRDYYRAVFSLFFKKGFSKEESEDLAQKTFLRVYENWDNYEGKAIWSYLVVTARSVLSNHLRDRGAAKRGAKVTDSLDAPGTVEKATLHSSSAIPSPQEILEIKTNEEWLKAALEELPHDDRRCVLLWFEGLSFRSIGAALKCSAQAAKTRCFRIRAKLRKRWEDESEGDPQS